MRAAQRWVRYFANRLRVAYSDADALTNLNSTLLVRIRYTLTASCGKDNSYLSMGDPRVVWAVSESGESFTRSNEAESWRSYVHLISVEEMQVLVEHCRWGKGTQ